MLGPAGAISYSKERAGDKLRCKTQTVAGEADQETAATVFVLQAIQDKRGKRMTGDRKEKIEPATCRTKEGELHTVGKGRSGRGEGDTHLPGNCS